MADVYFAQAETIVLIQDNLNTHAAASLYEAFPAPEAKRLVERFEWHYTPKHGSWLDLAESELGVLSAQCLDRRIPDKQTLIEEIAAWEHDRNANHTKADWQFTTQSARVKPKYPYPSNLGFVLKKLTRKLANSDSSPLLGGLIMRYDLTDFEWSVIEPVLPKGRRGRQPQNKGRS